jgi:hypothetical protein
MTSFDSTLVHFEQALDQLHKKRISLPNRTLDTGFPTVYGEYAIADQNYNELLLILNKNRFQLVCEEIKNSLSKFYAGAISPSKKQDKTQWREISAAIESLNEVQMADINSSSTRK